MNQAAAPASADAHMLVPRPGQPAARARWLRVSAGLWAGTVLAAVATVAMTVVAWGNLTANDGFSELSGAVAAVTYATLGALIVRRADNLIGWIMMGVGAGLAFLGVASAYAVIGALTYPSAVPAPKLVGLLAECSFVPCTFTIAFMFLLFPSGKLPSRRWRPLAAAGLVLAGLTLSGLAVRPRLVQIPAPGGTSLTFQNPLGVAGLWPVLRVALVGTLSGMTVVFVAFLAASIVSLVVRYRAGDPLQRQQIKWLAMTALMLAVFLVIALLGIAAGQTWVTNAAYQVVPIVVFFGIPAVVTVAILRHRLFDIDVIISRAVVYGLLSAAFTGVYAGIVLGIGTFAGHRGGPVLTVAAAVCIALLFQPLRHRFRQFANRLVYGERATPYQVLSDFAGDMAGQLGYGEALDKMVSLLAGATGATRAGAWIRIGTELRPAATWPPGSPPPAPVTLSGHPGLPPLDAASRALPVRHGDELLGALSLRKPANEPLTTTEDQLLQHLASQAGLVLRNVQLTAELQATIDELTASRRRLIETQDAERRKIERNLHDGAQQQLIAATIQLSLLEQTTDDPGHFRQLAAQLKNALRAALDDLRDLARGIYPPLLADQGLAAALHAQARKTPLPVTIETSNLGRYPPDTETTIYFCTLEALQNITKYAHATHATIHLTSTSTSLHFTITDNGTGFDTTTPHHGTGLQGMTDRLTAHGGTLTIHSQPGHGTTLTGHLPLPARDGKDKELRTR
jgi:signal transduction histidine kinase